MNRGHGGRRKVENEVEINGRTTTEMCHNSANRTIDWLNSRVKIFIFVNSKTDWSKGIEEQCE